MNIREMPCSHVIGKTPVEEPTGISAYSTKGIFEGFIHRKILPDSAAGRRTAAIKLSAGLLFAFLRIDTLKNEQYENNYPGFIDRLIFNCFSIGAGCLWN